MTTHTVGDIFCLYFWRSLQAPGTLYFASNIHSARAVCAELTAAGYIVKIVQMATDIEYELRNGALVPRSQPAPRPMARKQPLTRSTPRRAAAGLTG